MLLGTVRNLSASIKSAGSKPAVTLFNQERCLWLWFYNLFNRIDYERLEKVGPDRSCGEWVLKNGGAVRFKIQNELINDYNNLAPETSDLVKDHLVEIYADDASINDYGFYHLENCKHIQKVTFISCRLVGDTGLERLHTYLNDCLKYLEIRSCPGISDKGVLTLTEMRYLDKLIMHKMPGIVKKDTCEQTLKEILHNTDCDLNL